MDRRKNSRAAGKGAPNDLFLENLYSKSNAELMEEIERCMGKAEQSDFDPDYVDACLRILQERDPVMTGFDPAAEIQKLPLDVEAAHGADRRRMRRVRVWRVAEIAAVLAVLFALAVGAGRFDVFRMLRELGSETVSVTGEPSGVMVLPDVESDPGNNRFASLQEALDAYGVTTALCPTWIPSDYTIETLDFYVMENAKVFNCEFTSERGFLKIKISTILVDSGDGAEEVYPEGGYIYFNNGVEYYILENTNNLKCSWTIDGYDCKVSGAITGEEMEKMIDSIE